MKKLCYMSDTLGIDVSKGTEITHSDSHGGFHGDGITTDDSRIGPYLTDEKDTNILYYAKLDT